MGNNYFKHSKITPYKFRLLVKNFCMDMNATQISVMSRLNRNTVNKYISVFRSELSEFIERNDSWALPTLNEVVEKIKTFTGKENSEHLFSAEKKMVICSIDGHILTGHAAHNYNKLFLNCFKTDIGKTVVFLFSPYYSPKKFDWSEFMRLKKTLTHKQKEGNTGLSDIESFTKYFFIRLKQFKGIRSKDMLLHLRETNFRYYRSNDEMYHTILDIFRNKV